MVISPIFDDLVHNDLDKELEDYHKQADAKGTI
jgi:hypothetical protein